ncbi:hypothetical protein [Streptosporangium sp. CA-115845]|uniref:hypothetical protein n=1 Tax=Streptosporangium sp. CA-115845 TaxID=3240071 RepID=UPI003D928CC9
MTNPDDTTPAATEQNPTAHGHTTHTVPLRPDGWPDWLGRRPMTSIDEYGGALLPRLLAPEETVEIRGLYDKDDTQERSVIVRCVSRECMPQ